MQDEEQQVSEDSDVWICSWTERERLTKEKVDGRGTERL